MPKRLLEVWVTETASHGMRVMFRREGLPPWSRWGMQDHYWPNRLMEMIDGDPRFVVEWPTAYAMIAHRRRGT